MTTSAGRDERQQVLATARTYRRKGYQVSFPERGDPLPPFLAGLRPDLVAVRDDDRVVVEVRRVDAVPGSNDLITLAERIAPHEGWRFELIAIAAPKVIRPPDLGSVGDEATRLAAQGFVRAGFLVAYAALEVLLASAAAREGIRVAGVSTTLLARELTVTGMVSSEDYQRVRASVSLRDASMNDADAITKADLADLLSLERALERDLSAQSP